MFTFVAFLAFIALVSANANGSGQCTVPKELGGITGMKDRARDGTVTVTVSKESANVGDKITVSVGRCKAFCFAGVDQRTRASSARGNRCWFFLARWRVACVAALLAQLTQNCAA